MHKPVDGAEALSDYDKRVMRAIGDRAGTWMIAARMNVPSADMRRRLNRLDRQGFVHRSPQSSINNIIWLQGPAKHWRPYNG